ncbi:DUF397 domain-containing protein [Lipingzhangella sp. LS1_29]|uniref:DUF397 domain-containing protein n=1 Tax=Lipingzhangella rawalii TaxID=2055835 RepID=A0ABU2H7P7_9ACTN|nr:DUF397 domain-containing protein [Lipingzhangella rawalii]MDS1271336.1 DUF397 domain-containing protein [Lipingzhangella rawalii]
MKLTSSYSTQQGACVQVEQVGDEFHVTDSKHPDRGPHIYTRTEWRAFLNGAKNGEFDFDVYQDTPANS